MARRGRLICLMGIDGSGKTTQARLLQNDLAESGMVAEYVWSRWEPRFLLAATRFVRRGHSHAEGASNSAVGNRKRRLMSNPIVRFGWIVAGLTDYALSAHSRMTRVLRTADVVVCDRYLPDYVVDQMLNTGDSSWTMRRVFGSALARAFPVPDCVLFIDIEPALAFARKDDGIPVDELELKSQAYHRVAEVLGAIRVPAEGSEASVSLLIKEVVQSRLEDWRTGESNGSGRRRWPRP